jgi:hypothetical protein
MANQYKIYTVGNFLEIEDVNNGYIDNIRKQDVKIKRHDNSNEWYDIFDRGNNIYRKLFLTQILKQDGTPYTFEEFEEFRGCSFGAMIIEWACSHND